MSAAAPIPTPKNKPRSTKAQDISWMKEKAIRPASNFGIWDNQIVKYLFAENRLEGLVEARLILVVYESTVNHFTPGGKGAGPAYHKAKLSELAELLNVSTTAVENAINRLSELPVTGEDGEMRPWRLLDVKKNGVVYGLKLCPDNARFGPLQQPKTLRKPAGSDEESRPVITDKEPVVVMPGNTSRPLPLSAMLERSQCRPPANWDKMPAAKLQIEWESQVPLPLQFTTSFTDDSTLRIHVKSEEIAKTLPTGVGKTRPSAHANGKAKTTLFPTGVGKTSGHVVENAENQQVTLLRQALNRSLQSHIGPIEDELLLAIAHTLEHTGVEPVALQRKIQQRMAMFTNGRGTWGGVRVLLEGLVQAHAKAMKVDAVQFDAEDLTEEDREFFRRNPGLIE